MVQSPRTRMIALAALGVETRTRGSHRLSSKRDAPRMLLSSQLRRLEVYPHAESRATSTMFSICVLLFISPETSFAYHECVCVCVGRAGAPEKSAQYALPPALARRPITVIRCTIVGWGWAAPWLAQIWHCAVRSAQGGSVRIALFCFRPAVPT